MNHIGVVLVTFNRLEKLKIALQCFSSQTCSPAYVIVVNNASTDGTGDYLLNWEKKSESYKKIVCTLPSNTGGSGGFWQGLKLASSMSSNWIWVSDDDAFPKSNCLEIAEDFINRTPRIDDFSAVCATVLNRGEINVLHRRRIYRKGFQYCSDPVPKEEYEREFYFNAFSYVGSVINKAKMDQVGLTEKDYFIWNDDTEHSLRLSKAGKIVCLPDMNVIHDEVQDNVTFSWKAYYGTRNRLNMMKKHFPKWFFFYQWTKYAFFAVRRYYADKEQGRLYLSAVKDSLKKKLGLHSVYKPGWKPKKI